MRTAVYLVALLVLQPYFALAAAFLVLGNAIAGGTLLAFFETLLKTALWLIPWGFIAGALALAALLALAADERHRWIGSTFLCVGAAASLVIIVVLAGGPLESGQIVFLLPCALAGIGAGWVAAGDRRALRNAAASAPLAPAS